MVGGEVAPRRGPERVNASARSGWLRTFRESAAIVRSIGTGEGQQVECAEGDSVKCGV